MNLVTHLGPSDWAALLLAVALKGTLIFLAAFFIVGLLRRASAATRHAVWTLALAAALILPVLFLVLPGWQVPVLPAPPVVTFHEPTPPSPPVAPAAPRAPLARMAPLASPPTPPSPPSAPRVLVSPKPERPIQRDADVEVRSDVQVHVLRDHVHSRSVIIERREAVVPGGAVAGLPTLLSSSSPMPVNDWRSWLLLVWIAGTVIVAARWFFAMLGAWRLVQRAEPVYDLEWLELKERIAFGLDLNRPVRLLRSDRITVPVACGISTPVVLLPADADEWSEDRREVVLTHEMAHILRRDCLTQLIAQAALVVHWFNPLAWAAHRRFLLEREHACDDYVINNGARASDYADHLMNIARRFRRDSLSLSATAPMARRSNLEGRILSILDTEQNRSATSRGRLVGFSVLALALVLPLAAFHPVEAEPDEHIVRLAPVVVKAEPLPVSQPELLMITSLNGDDTFTWEGRVSSGDFVEVHGINGSIRARTGSGDRVRVEAEKKSDRGREDDVEIVVNEFANGVVICTVYPGQSRECEPGQGAEGNIRDNDVNVQFDIELPENVRFVGRTVNGSIKTETLGSDVDIRTVNGSVETASRRGDVTAKTVNGSVKAEAAGIVRAGTVNGSIKARMGRANWDGTLDFSTTNGSITLELPGDLSTEVHAEAGTGSIKSDFPLDVRRDGYTGASAKGRIGSGGRDLTLEVLNGSIKLRRAGAFGTSIGMNRTERDERRAEERERWAEERQRRAEAQHRRVEERYHHLATQALADIGPEMERAMEEAARALEAVDFEGEIASALASVDWSDMQRDIERALEDVEVNIDWNSEAEWDEAWEDAEEDLVDALDDIRDELADLEEELAEGDLQGVTERQLREAKAALRQAERDLERGLRDARHHRHALDDDCEDDQ